NVNAADTTTMESRNLVRSRIPPMVETSKGLPKIGFKRSEVRGQIAEVKPLRFLPLQSDLLPLTSPATAQTCNPNYAPCENAKGSPDPSPASASAARCDYPPSACSDNSGIPKPGSVTPPARARAPRSGS